VASLGGTGEHLRCTACRTCYRVELLAVPTIEQMLAALLAGTKAAVLAMLRSGGADSQVARRRGIQMIRAAGAPEYGDEQLTAALGARPMAGPGAAERPREIDEPGVGLRPAIEAFAIQLDIHAREWFLAKVVEVGLADGSLTAQERAVAGTVARHLGMSPARGEDVISLVEAAGCS
jgi:hypothetical protein